MRITRRAVLGAMSGSALAACSRTDEVAGTGLTVGLTYVPNVQFSPFYVGLDQGIFAEHDLEVTLRHHGEQEDLFTALTTGTEDVVYAATDEAMVAAAGGADLATFATCYQQYPVVILGQAEAMTELAGATVGLPGRFGSTYYALQAALAGAGMSEDDIDVVEIGYTQVSALTTGKVAAIVGYRNNELVQLQAQGYPHSVIEASPTEAPLLVGPGLHCGRAVETSELRKLAQALRACEQTIVDDLAVGLDATASRVPTLADQALRTQAAAVLEATAAMWLRDGAVTTAVDAAAVERMGEFLTAQGIIPATPKELVRTL